MEKFAALNADFMSRLNGLAVDILDAAKTIDVKMPSTTRGRVVMVTLAAATAAGLFWRFHFRRICFARFLSGAVPVVNKRLEPRKKKFFSGLEELRKDKGGGRNLVIIDVGSGNGVNFQYYPEGSEVICVDPNRNFEPFLRAGSDTWPTGVLVSRYHAVYCERMHEVIDPEVADVVIVGSLLCSVYDVSQCLREVHRVLKPGGKVFFMEHVLSPRCYPYVRLLQRLVNPVWSFIMDGCNVNRSLTENNFLEAGFSSVDMEEIEVYELELPPRVFFAIRMLRSRVWGTATK